MSEDVSFKDVLLNWHDNWFLSRVGFYLGSVLALGGLGLLAYGIYRGVQSSKGLDQAAGQVASISPDKVDPANEGKLVHVVGEARTKENLSDPDLGVSLNTIRLTRKVEMYQWQEKKEKKKKEKDAKPVFTYDHIWSRKLIDSSKFNQKAHTNPDAMPFEDKTWQAEEVTCGAFTLAPSLIGKIKGDERVPASELSKAKPPDKIRVHEGQFYKGDDPNKPNVGDARIELQVAKPGTISVIAKQVKSGLEPYQDSNGQTTELLAMGTHSADAMFTSAQQGHAILTVVLGVLGFLVLGFGLYLVGQPNLHRADTLPLVGEVLSLGGIAFGVVMGLVSALLVSGILLAASKPLISLPMLAVAAVVFVGARFWGARKQASTDGTANLPGDGPKVARSIKRRGGSIWIYGEGGEQTISVTLDGKKFGNDALTELAAVPTLTELSLNNTAIDGAGLAKLPQAKTVKTLSIRGDLAAQGIQAIGAMTGLKKINLSECKLIDQNLAQLKGLTRLEEADLSDTLLSDAGLAHLSNWTGLKKLQLSGGTFTGNGLDACKNMPQLESLWVSNTKLTDAGMVGLTNLRGLKELFVGINDINGDGLQHVQGMSRLEHLDLGHSKVGDKGLMFLQKLAALQELNLERTKVTDAGLAHVKGLPVLKKIDLNRVQVTDKGMAHLSGIASLEELCIDRTKITDAGLPAIARMPNLRNLHLDHTAITDAGLIHLNRLASLSWLTLSSTKVTEARVESLRQALPGASIETTGWRGIGDDIEDPVE